MKVWLAIQRHLSHFVCYIIAVCMFILQSNHSEHNLQMVSLRRVTINDGRPFDLFFRKEIQQIVHCHL